MLVLSRRPHQKILIPAIQACIHVAAVQPGVVRVAIDAPREVAILRGELQDRGEPSAPTPPPCERAPEPTVDQPRDRAAGSSRGRRVRRTCQRLQAVSAGLGLARLQLRAGLTSDAHAALAEVHEEIQGLRRWLEGKRRKSPTQAARPDPVRKMSVAADRDARQKRVTNCVC